MALEWESVCNVRRSYHACGDHAGKSQDEWAEAFRADTERRRGA